MKSLIRKIFFWDSPAQGAFFALTLLITVPWLLFSLFCGILIFDFTLYRTGYTQILFFSVIVIVALYTAALFLKMLCVCIRMTPHFWRRLIVLVAVDAAITFIYAVTMLFETGIYRYWFTAIISVLSIAYLFHPIVKPWKVLASSIAWIGAFLVFLAICTCAYEPFRVGTLRELSHPSWLYCQLRVHVLYDYFDLGGNGCFWFAALGSVKPYGVIFPVMIHLT